MIAGVVRFSIGATFNVIRGGGLFSMIMGESPAKSCLVGIWAQMMGVCGKPVMFRHWDRRNQ